MNQPVIDLCMALIACPSVSPHDHHCQQLLIDRLTPLSFHCEKMKFGEVDNLWARLGDQGPLFVFAGHTDVVPPGPLEDWATPPFTPSLRDGQLYGRGASDMKSGIAAMVCAVEKYVTLHGHLNGSIAFLITSDEEADAVDGTKKVIDALTQRGIHIDYCLVGEPSSATHVGDQIRVGRRGSLHGQLTIHGKQGHVAHPHLASNPIHNGAAALATLAAKAWDSGNASFPPTTFQITNVHAGTGVANVIPGHLEVMFNFRFGTASTVAQLQTDTESILHAHHLTFDLKWKIGGESFLTSHGKLISATQTAIKKVTGQTVNLSTGGGTSDGRFIAPTGAEVVELGVSHATAHQVNEHVSVQDIVALTDIYYVLLQEIFN